MVKTDIFYNRAVTKKNQKKNWIKKNFFCIFFKEHLEIGQADMTTPLPSKKEKVQFNTSICQKKRKKELNQKHFCIFFKEHLEIGQADMTTPPPSKKKWKNGYNYLLSLLFL